MNITKRQVIVKTQLEALHRWETIPKGHRSQFLQYPHRHIFHIEVIFNVSHNDRDIEFIEMKQLIDNLLQRVFSLRDTTSGLIDLGSMSCEMLCELLLEQFHCIGAVSATVLEDGEMGSMLSIQA